MAAKKQAPKKQPTIRERVSAWYQETSRRLNPTTYAQPKAQEQMKDAWESHGGGARRDRINQVVDSAVTGQEPRRGNRR